MRRSAVLLALGLLAGCSNAPFPPEAPGKRIIHLSMRDEPTSLDPAASLLPGIVDVVHPAYFGYDYLKRNPVPLTLVLGAEFPKRRKIMLPDGRSAEEWSFRLKMGLHFQDDPCFPAGKGREITGDDMLFAFRRMADPRIAAPYFSYVEKRILGLSEFAELNRQRIKEGKPVDLDAPVTGLQRDPQDPFAFRLLLSEPFPQLKYIMALRCCSPQAREALSYYGEDLRRHPVGMGDFRISAYLPKQRIDLVPNPNRLVRAYPSEGAPGDRERHLLDDAGKRLPRSDGISYSMVRESVTSWNRFLQGYEDAWSVNQTNYQSVMSQGDLSPEMKRRGIQLERAAIPNVIGFVFNMEDPTFGGYSTPKRKLRQAISLAIDRQEIIDLFTQGTAQPAEFLVPPNIGGYDPKFRNPYSGRDLARAKALLAEAGYRNGIDPNTGERLAMYFDTAAQDSLGRQFVGILKRQLADVGINLVPRFWRPVVMSERNEKGQWQFIEFDWFADYPDPEMFLLMLYGPNKRPGMNRSNYANVEVDRLFEQIRVMEDGPERAALIAQLRNRAVEDCPWVYVRHNRSLLLSQPWLRNRKMPEVDADMTQYWTVDTELRKRKIEEWNRPVLWPILLGGGFFLVGTVPAFRLMRRRAISTLRERGRSGGARS